jgi:hypothetical protein
LRRNCLLKHVTERKLEGRDKRDGETRRRCKQLLDEFRKGENTGK